MPALMRKIHGFLLGVCFLQLRSKVINYLNLLFMRIIIINERRIEILLLLGLKLDRTFKSMIILDYNLFIITLNLICTIIVLRFFVTVKHFLPCMGSFLFRFGDIYWVINVKVNVYVSLSDRFPFINRINCYNPITLFINF